MYFDYHFETGLSNTIYWGRQNSIFIKSDFLYNEGFNYGVDIKALSNCFIKGIYPIVQIIPIDKPICTVQVFYKDELKLTQHFVVIDLPNPALMSPNLRDWTNERSTNYDEIIQSEIQLSEFESVNKISAGLIVDGSGNQCINFKLSQFNFSVLRDREIIFTTVNNGDVFNEEIKSFKRQLQTGDRVLFENIVCSLNEYGNERRIDKRFNYHIVRIV